MKQSCNRCKLKYKCERYHAIKVLTGEIDDYIILLILSDLSKCKDYQVYTSND